MTVFTPELMASFDASTAPVEHARMLPSVCYSSPEFFQFERDVIWGHDWVAVGHVRQIENPGDYFTIDMAGEPLIVVRDKDSAIHVLSAVCRHQGMSVTEGAGNCTKFTCPYHLWTYALDGRLLGAPAMERTLNFVKDEHQLPSLPVEVWNGFIFTTFDPHAPPLAPSLEPAADVLRNYDLEHAFHIADDNPVLPWNWKVMLENFIDGYHSDRLHQFIYDYGPGEGLEFIPASENDNHITRINHQTVRDASFTPMLHAVLPVFSKLTDEQRMHGTFVLLLPSLALAIQPDQVVYFIISPRAADTIQITIGWLIDPAGPQDPLFQRKFQQVVKPGVMNFVVDDIRVDTRVQIGLSSRFAPRGRYSWQQATHVQLNRWCVKRYREHWPSTTDELAPREPVHT